MRESSFNTNVKEGWETLPRFDKEKYNPLMDTDILVDWRVFNPLDYIHKLKEVCDAYHFKMS